MQLQILSHMIKYIISININDYRYKDLFTMF